MTYWSEYQQLFFFGQNYTGHVTLFQFILPVIFIFRNARNFSEVCMQKLRQENHVFNSWWNKNFMTPSISKVQSHYEETAYFLPFSSHEFLVLNWSTSVGCKAELTLEPPSGFETRIPRLGIQYLNH